MLAPAARASAPVSQRTRTAPEKRTGASPDGNQTFNPAWSMLAYSAVSHSAGPNGSRLHADASAASGAARLGAAALTVGRDIFFGHNQYARNVSGDRVLRHELHTSRRRTAMDHQSTPRFALADLNHPAEREAS
jgi:hypothetical protein